MHSEKFKSQVSLIQALFLKSFLKQMLAWCIEAVLTAFFPPKLPCCCAQPLTTRGKHYISFLSTPPSWREQKPRRRHELVWIIVSVNSAFSLPPYIESYNQIQLT